jgi:HAE1 family hydrophobic/amphiphilic exporter-1
MLIVALLVLGMASYRNPGVDLYPKIDFPNVTVTTTLRGASPEEISARSPSASGGGQHRQRHR